MRITMTHAQRFGLVGLLNQQQPKKLKDQLTNFDVLQKIEFDDLTQKALLTPVPGGGVMLDRKAGEQTSEVEFEKAEIRAIIDLLNSADLRVTDVRWAAPLLRICLNLELPTAEAPLMRSQVAS